MNKKIFAALLALTAALALAFAPSSVDRPVSARGQAPQLAALLPASDGIATVDLKRLFGEALPQILSADRAKLDKMTASLDKFKSKTGIDLRQFEQVAVGINKKKTDRGDFGVEPVVLARGPIDVNRLIDAAKEASKGSFRVENEGGRSIYVFKTPKSNARSKLGNTNTMLGKIVSRVYSDIEDEVAVASLDAGTIVFGTLPRVRETLGGKSRISDDLLGMVYRDQTGFMSFGANMPDGMVSLLNLGNAEIDRNVNAIKQIYGSMDVDGSSATLRVTARAAKIVEAQELERFLKGMAEVGKVLIGGSKGADKQIYRRMIENARISSADTEVTLLVQVPQTDIDTLLGKK